MAGAGFSAGLTAESYLELMSARQQDRDAREAFRATVLQIARAPGRIFDFGAGPGLDAKFYAEHGLTVSAYDNDPHMRAAFARYCSAEICAGTVTLYGGDYTEFLREATGGSTSMTPVSLITSNFAPLNLVDDLHGLFRALHKLSSPRGLLLASVLNPGYFRDMRYGWWWANRWNYWRSGQFKVSGRHGRVWRRSCTVFGRCAEPFFRLQSVRPGLLQGQTVSLRFPRSLALRRSQYLLLLFERQ